MSTIVILRTTKREIHSRVKQLQNTEIKYTEADSGILQHLSFK